MRKTTIILVGSFVQNVMATIAMNNLFIIVIFFDLLL
jgi:hypothetical protein